MGVNPSPIPAAFCWELFKSHPEKKDGQLAPMARHRNPWSRSRAAHDGSWNSCLSEGKSCSEQEEVVGTAPALTAPHPSASDTSKSRAGSGENDPKGIVCSAFLVPAPWPCSPQEASLNIFVFYGGIDLPCETSPCVGWGRRENSPKNSSGVCLLYGSISLPPACLFVPKSV